MELEPGTQVGHYSVVRRLGQGGMSNVYMARDSENDRDVVLKFPHQDLMGDISSHERFRREVKIGQLLKHPNIQELHELSYAGNNEFIVLEYVAGEPLRYVLRERQQRTPEDFDFAVKLGVQIGSALSYAHSNHVAHRDLKPENIIVAPDGTAKVMDFGIALLQGARRVTWGPLSTQVGTPDYMAPEQIQGGRGDVRTDIYALGMMLYEIIAHKLPYTGDNALAVMNQHVNVKAPLLHKHRKETPPALEETIMKALRLRPQDRWPSMEAMVSALQHPESVDVDALRAEREAEREGAVGGKVARAIPIPINPVTGMVALSFVAILIVVVVLFTFAGHGHR
ncbi:MAG: serine/threonine-protein kinase [Capsulimonadaceae bacterium]|nr:serine/threonine-protein kinase [Capsulimonadaceae bacterium]